MSSAILKKISSFTYLNTAQFIAALNDNLYKLLVIYLFIQLEGIENSHRILASTGAVFVLPFLLFSASSGVLADRFSKRNIIVMTKFAEFMTLSASIIAFYFESKLGAYCILFLMATYSAIFAPSKYSIIPEIVSVDKINKANGLLTSFTFLAIILGTFIASFLLEISGRNFMFAAYVCTFLAFIALLASLRIEYTPPSGSAKQFNILFLKEILSTLKDVSTFPSLLMAVFGSAYFMLLGGFLQLNMIPFAVQSLHLTDTQGGYLFLIAAIGIAAGSLISGKISGKTAELGLVPLALIGVAISCFMMDFFSDMPKLILPIILFLGLFGGIYQVPLDSYIQVASPNTSRGQVVAATNFLSFFGVLCSSALVYFNTALLGVNADKGFTIIGVITMVMAGLITYQYFDYLTRFIGMILSKLHFDTEIEGEENIPETPAIYLCTHRAWNDTLLILGAQRRRMRFFIEQEQHHSNRWIAKIYRLLRVVFIPEVETLENNPAHLAALKKLLQKGISVCIFVNNEDLSQEIEKLQLSFYFKNIEDETNAPVIPVHILKWEKEERDNPLITKLLKKFQVPAKLRFDTRVL